MSAVTTGASADSYSLITGWVLPYGPEKGFGKTMGLAPYGRAHPGPVLDFSPQDHGMSSDYSAFFSRPPLPRIVAQGVRRCEDRERVLDPYFARRPTTCSRSASDRWCGWPSTRTSAPAAATSASPEERR